MNYTGTLVRGSAATLHTGPGKLQAVLISHSMETAQVVSFYDAVRAAGTPLLRLYVAAGQSPYYLVLHDPIPFSTALSANPGNCELAVWAVGK